MLINSNEYLLHFFVQTQIHEIMGKLHKKHTQTSHRKIRRQTFLNYEKGIFCI